MTEVNSPDECGTADQKGTDQSSQELVVIVNGARTSNSIDSVSIDSLKPSEAYLIVDFSLINNRFEEGYEFNPNFVLVEDSQGYSYDYSWDSARLSRYWGGMLGITIEHGSKKSGELAFVVPDDETEFFLVIKDMTGTLARERFSVE